MAWALTSRYNSFLLLAGRNGHAHLLLHESNLEALWLVISTKALLELVQQAHLALAGLLVSGAFACHAEELRGHRTDKLVQCTPGLRSTVPRLARATTHQPRTGGSASEVALRVEPVGCLVPYRTIAGCERETKKTTKGEGEIGGNFYTALFSNGHKTP